MGLCLSEPWRLLKVALLQCMASLLATGMSSIVLYLLLGILGNVQTLYVLLLVESHPFILVSTLRRSCHCLCVKFK